MGMNEKNLIYRVAREYFKTYEPEQVEELEVVFDATFKMLSRQPDLEPAPEKAYGRLHFESAFVEATAIASVTWIVTLLVRTVATGPLGEDVVRRLDDLEKQLVRHTRQLERVGRIVAILTRMTDDLAELKEKTVGPASPADWSVIGRGNFDLGLRIRGLPDASRRCFRLELYGPGPDLECHRAFGPIRLTGNTSEYFAELFAEVQDLPLEQRGDGVAEELADLGSDLYRRLVPDELGELLGSLLDGRSVRTLWIWSDEPWIPWELLRLPEDVGTGSPFLCEAFAVCRWLGDRPPTLRLPLSNMAIVAPRKNPLDWGVEEVRFLLDLRREGRAVREVPAHRKPLRQALASGVHDGWHFCCHGQNEDDPDRATILLEDDARWTPRNLSGDVRRLGEPSPLVFLNSCHSSRTDRSLTGIGGWAEAFIEAGAGAFLGAYWSIDDDRAWRFCRSFYRSFLAGTPIAEAVRRARLAIREPDDSTWLAYTVYAHPLAVSKPSTAAET